MNLRKRQSLTAEVFSASMNDIMFFLMLFFIIVSTLLNPNIIDITLPTSKASQTLHVKEINLTVTKDLKYYIDNQEVKFDKLEPMFATEIAANKELTVMLRCDAALSIQELVKVLELQNRLKLKMVLNTKSN